MIKREYEKYKKQAQELMRYWIDRFENERIERN